MKLKILYRAVAVVVAVVAVVVLAAGQSSIPARDSGGNGLLSCSPAPCVLPPTQVSFGVDALDAPIAADPANPARITVGADYPQCSPQSGLAFYVTNDGGSDWSTFCMVPFFSGQQEYIPDGDPVLAYDRNGVAYIGGFYLDDSGRTEFGFEGFEKSSDGVNWSSPGEAVIRRDYVPGYCWMAIDDSAASPYVNSVYISCVMVGPLSTNANNQVVVTRSTDGGATWQQANVTTIQKSPARDFYTAMAVGKDGTVYVTWEYCNQDNACDNGLVYIAFSKSTDGGNTWSKPRLVVPVNLIYPLPNTQIFVPETPAIAVDDSSGSQAGNLYVTMYNWTGSFMQVQVVRSTDGGTTWSKPVPVASGETHDQFFPWISVSPNGLVGVSWLDRRNDPANVNYQAYAGISSNGGLSFQNVQLTTAFSNPNTGAVNFSIGNYTGNTWNGANYFLAAWMDDSQTMYMQDFVGGIRLK
jgi:hypothetical protein